MHQLTLRIEHALSQPEARQRVQQLVEQVQRSGGRSTQRWVGKERLLFSAERAGGTVTGEVLVGQDRIEVTIHLPPALLLFARRIQEVIEQSAQYALNSR